MTVSTEALEMRGILIKRDSALVIRPDYSQLLASFCGYGIVAFDNQREIAGWLLSPRALH